MAVLCVCVCVCVYVCVRERERERERDTHMVRRAMFSIERFGDEHLPDHGVDVEHLVGRLIRSHPGDAVSDRDVLVLVGANLHHNKTKREQSVDQSDSRSIVCLAPRFAKLKRPAPVGAIPAAELL